MGKTVEVVSLPNCDFCLYDDHRERKAEYDGRTVHGPWANMCQEHFTIHGVGLGTGKGQQFVLKSGD